MNLEREDVDRLGHLIVLNVDNFGSFHDRVEVTKAMLYYNELSEILKGKFSFSFMSVQTFHNICATINEFYRSKEINVFAVLDNTEINGNNCCAVKYKDTQLFQINFNI